MTAPEVAETGARLTVERRAGSHVVGWAHDPGAPGQERLALEVGGRRVPLAPRRVPRSDVAQALGLPPQGPALGFEMELPADDAMAPDLALVLLGAAHEGAVSCRVDLPDAAAEMPLANVEGWTGLSLAGWLADRPEAPEAIWLRCDGRRFETVMRRVSRRDVAQSLGRTDELLGFECEVPGTLWRDAPGAGQLSIQLEGRTGPVGPVWVLRRDELAGRLASALALTDPTQRAHQALLAMEHLAWAGRLSDADEGSRQALAVLAESAGVSAWLREPPQSLSHGIDSAAAARPFQITPKGKLAQWLGRPGNPERALSGLLWMRRRRWLSGLANRWEIMLTLATGLFDKACYDRQISPAERAGGPALRHYVEQGDARSLVPMVMFDARHYTGQLEGRRHPGVNRLLHYALVGRRKGLSPCAWFDPGYYLDSNADVRDAGALDPFTHFVNWGWKEGRRPAARFQPTTSARRGLLQRLATHREAANPESSDPLQRYLLDGLPADAQPVEADLLPWSVPARLDGRDYLDLGPWRSLPRPAAGTMVDVVVPVYAGAQETLRCIWSVLASQVATPFELVVIDDCSPEPALSAHLRALEQLGLIHLLVNERNLGFVATVNLGLALHRNRDVVILNSDTRVHPGWLDRICAHGVAEPRAASVTPLSNNATICSYPRSRHSNWERLEVDDAALDALAAQVNAGRHVEVPTGVGFCMWMRRAALDAVGMLDTERFGRGYGEENDWCQRALAAGWVNLAAGDVYVLHQGSVSFAAESGERTRAGLATLHQLHPGYLRSVDDWTARDPLLPERARLDAARLKRAAHTAPDSGLVLMVSHARGGGTARHEAEEATRLARERALGTVTMRPSRRSGCVSLGMLGGALDLPSLQDLPLLDHSGPAARPKLSPLLLDLLGALELREVQLHHLLDHPPALRDRLAELCDALQVPLTVTVHDYHLVCPRTNLVDASGFYCGEPDRDACNRCLQMDELGRAAGRIAPWRSAAGALLSRAERVVVPDIDVASRLARYFPAIRTQVQPHEDLVIPSARPPRASALRHVLVVGALSQIKGFSVLRGLSSSRLAREAGLKFTLLGYSTDDGALREAGVEVLGRYEDADLQRRISELAPDLILLPSVWPETFCYALTPAGASGRPVAVFDLGAQARRLRQAGADAIYLPVELAGQPEVLARLLISSFSGAASRTG